MVRDCKWQWVSKSYGGMGWFTNAEKRKLEKKPEFSSKDGHFRAIPAAEVESMARSIGAMAYDQS